jgi:hypothetical protein
MKPSEVLRAARKLIERPESWTQGTWARSANGSELPREKRDRAKSYCQMGATFTACSNLGVGGKVAERCLLLLRDAEQTENLAEWNDAFERKHGEVLEAFDRAIEIAESGQP